MPDTTALPSLSLCTYDDGHQRRQAHCGSQSAAMWGRPQSSHRQSNVRTRREDSSPRVTALAGSPVGACGDPTPACPACRAPTPHRELARPAHAGGVSTRLSPASPVVNVGEEGPDVTSFGSSPAVALLLAPALAMAQRDLSDHGRGWVSGVYWVAPLVVLMVLTFVYVARRIRTRRARRGLGPTRTG